MKWEMGMEEIEAVLEKIWDLHDKLSDAIHAISRSHFHNSLKTLKKSDDIFGSVSNNNNTEKKKTKGEQGEDGRNGFVFMKDIRMVDEAAMAEAKSLNAIRTALENLEDQLEFFHTVQSQQRAERDAAIARLEQSRIILAMRLADHHGKKYTVIEEAQAFVGDVHETGRFVSPENLFESPRNLCDENLKGEKYRFGTVMQVLLSSCNFAKRTLKLEQMGGVLGNAALVAVSMLALLHLHQAAISNNSKRNSKNKSQEGSSSRGFVRSLDVLEARG